MLNRLFTEVYGWACRRLYHELAGIYEPVADFVSLGQWDNWRRLALDYVDGSTVVELGPGTGQLLPPLAHRARHVIGVELSREMIAQSARELHTSGTVNGAVIAGDARALAFPAGSVDTIVSTFPAPYILDANTLEECRRILRPAAAGAGKMAVGGRLVVVGLWVRPAGETWISRSLRSLPFFYGEIKTATLDKLRERFQKHGLTVRLVERQSGFAYIGIAIAERDDTNRDDTNFVTRHTPASSSFS